MAIVDEELAAAARMAERVVDHHAGHLSTADEHLERLRTLRAA
jgi:hypothetical protein